MRKPAFCICENKDADQLRGNREADQRLCFPYLDSTIPLLLKSEISSLLPSSVVVLYSSVCVRPGGNTEDRFSRGMAQMEKQYLGLCPTTNKPSETVGILRLI